MTYPELPNLNDPAKKRVKDKGSKFEAPLYEFLDPSRSEICLLEVTPLWHNDNIIRCQLRTFSLAEAAEIPFYIALSYVWGNPAESDVVCVNGKLTSVTRSLGLALRDFQRAVMPRLCGRTNKIPLLWADAICINQQETLERNDQVRLMGSIYRTAFATISWIGGNDKRILSAINWLNLIARELLLSPRGDIIEEACRPVEWMRKYPELHGCNTNKRVVNRAWADIKHFLTLPY
ncbi:heterokaryon incompatibility protein-domain-containing protein [Xylariaceae sp. AK1471]|nr:heterokaryon incompatibility protein-domain-containing protein [Xylariaceae sp. AK1471]